MTNFFFSCLLRQSPEVLLDGAAVTFGRNKATGFEQGARMLPLQTLKMLDGQPESLSRLVQGRLARMLGVALAPLRGQLAAQLLQPRVMEHLAQAARRLTGLTACRLQPTLRR